MTYLRHELLGMIQLGQVGLWLSHRHECTVAELPFVRFREER